MATEDSKSAEEQAAEAAAKDAKQRGVVDPEVAAAAVNREIGPGDADKSLTEAENQTGDLEKKDSGSAVSSGRKSNPGKPGKGYDVETDPVIPSSVARDEVRKELEAFGESNTLAGLVENYKGDRNV